MTFFHNCPMEREMSSCGRITRVLALTCVLAAVANGEPPRHGIARVLSGT